MSEKGKTRVVSGMDIRKEKGSDRSRFSQILDEKKTTGNGDNLRSVGRTAKLRMVLPP